MKTFLDPILELPRNNQRVQFKVTGDLEVAGVKEPTLGRYVETDSAGPKLIGYFVDEESGNSFMVWRDRELEVSGWRPIEEYHKELH